MSRVPRRILLALLVAVLGVSIGAVASSARDGEDGDGGGKSATTVDDHNGGKAGEDRKGGKAGDDRRGAKTGKAGEDRRGGKAGEDRKGGKAGDERRGGKAGDDRRGGHRPDVYEISGDAVFPEGIALDRRGKSFFVSSTTDGTIFKGNVKRTALTPFAAGGADGRTTATGMKVDDRGRLLVAGAGTGKAFVLSTSDGSTLKVLDSKPGSSQTFINDVTVAGGFAYFTDSLRPVILRAATSGDSVGELEPWLDLTGTAFVYKDGFNANGIASFDDGRLLVVVQSNTGKLFRINTRTKAVSEIDLGGKTVTNGDGLVAHGSRLFVVRNADNEIVEVKLRRDKREGRVGRAITSDALMYPTTAARDGERLLVVNAQFDKRGGTPVLPFTVAAVRRP
jgi:sugar lactone lactonase YvrE